MMFLSDGTLEHLRDVADLPDLSETRYTLVRELARGGMGTVYLATDERLGREVAIKVLSAPDPDAARRMEQEARIVAGLEHPGIVPIHDAGTLPDGRVFYAMKRVRGDRLDEHAERSLPALLRIFERICEAVAFAHAHGVIHRDLKPENVMVGSFGEVLVMDWGVAKVAADDSDSSAGSVVGTHGYMPPEQGRGDVADERSDVFALGGILHFLLARQHPTPAATSLAGAPAELASICRKAMATEPGNRYASARELAAEVGRYLQGERVAAHRETILERVGRVASRHRAWILLVLAYLVMRLLLLLLRGT
ncbi:MAG: serine/threonine protein kinase [Thermoanaerobaculia bacterium]|nr:serine/threonine protein kinase [Thermoanaerobaculia bacterium]